MSNAIVACFVLLVLALVYCLLAFPRARKQPSEPGSPHLSARVDAHQRYIVRSSGPSRRPPKSRRALHYTRSLADPTACAENTSRAVTAA